MLKPSSRFVFIASSAVFLVVASITIAALVLQKRQVDRVFDQYAQALSSGDYQKAYSMCGPEFRSVTSFERFQLVNKNLRAQNGQLRRIVRTTSEVKWRFSSPNWIGRVLARMEFSNGEDHILYEFHQSEREWRLYGYEER
jgi:hypothetical protein